MASTLDRIDVRNSCPYLQTVKYGNLNNDWQASAFNDYRSPLSVDSCINNTISSYIDPLFINEFHYERIIHGYAIVQAGQNAKGLMATLPLFNWTTRQFDGINIDNYQNRVENSGLLPAVIGENNSEVLTSIIYIDSAFQLLTLMQIMNNVHGNSDTEFSNYLYTLDTKLQPSTNTVATQYSSSDFTSRFMVRVPTTTSIEQNN